MDNVANAPRQSSTFGNKINTTHDMLIKLDNTYYRLHGDTNGHWVDIPEKGAVRADSLSELIQKLEWQFDDVSLPQNLFTDDLSLLDEFIRMGFTRLEQKTMIISGFNAELKPLGYWSSKARDASPDTDRKYFRLYQATWTDEGGRAWTQIFTEAELENME